ncbi:four helix bundle protein [Luteolibacter yonseiensis]|uniref:Four helix bundle protein n=1 Tax=Luteolibacter yonseiensis TaxID=1144680 RepID=A0A934R3F2_9BACT|nr:four helix bundle protein [Luteolibacter yonseiensis]MBK1816117.1 four helix bundle protein [Luteolibacter yonseiensis]
MKDRDEPVYDLEERLLDYGAAIINMTRKLTSDYAERHVGNQLLRSGTAPASHHGEAQAAESPADFIHKMRLALKELRESERWLKLIQRTAMHPQTETIPKLLNETDQLIRIFYTSIATAERNRRSDP